LVPFSPRKGDPKISQTVVTAEGYKFAVLHGPQPVARDVSYAAVREGDSITINQAAGEVSHSINPLENRGKVLGVWVRIDPIHGNPQVNWYSRDDLTAIRNARSKSWQFNQDNSPWKTDEEAMMVKTAVKRALKPFAAEAEGLAMMYAEDDAAKPAPDERVEPVVTRDVTERASGVLESALGAIGDPSSDDVVIGGAVDVGTDEQEAAPAEEKPDDQEDRELF
jgi:recombinational DNA repair protein RecT